MPSNIARKKGKKNAKHGRNKLKCAAYRNERRRAKNKARNLKRHLVRHGTDSQAVAALAKLG